MVTALSSDESTILWSPLCPLMNPPSCGHVQTKTLANKNCSCDMKYLLTKVGELLSPTISAMTRGLTTWPKGSKPDLLDAIMCNSCSWQGSIYPNAHCTIIIRSVLNICRELRVACHQCLMAPVSTDMNCPVTDAD